LPLLALLPVATAQAEQSVFQRTIGDAVVDWRTGTITAEAGSAADIGMPGPSAARPGAERRARARAEDRLRTAVQGLTDKAAVIDDKFVSEHATVSRVEYQSNGGVVLWLSLRFSDFVPVKASSVALKAPAARLEIAPVLSVAGRDVAVGFATYRPMGECPKDALPVRRDASGKLVLTTDDAKLADSLAGAAVVIYVEKPLP
jgi:hypothetical protein